MILYSDFYRKALCGFGAADVVIYAFMGHAKCCFEKTFFKN